MHTRSKTNETWDPSNWVPDVLYVSRPQCSVCGSFDIAFHGTAHICLNCKTENCEFESIESAIRRIDKFENRPSKRRIIVRRVSNEE
jgi:hypothetical protein